MSSAETVFPTAKTLTFYLFSTQKCERGNYSQIPDPSVWFTVTAFPGKRDIKRTSFKRHSFSGQGDSTANNKQVKRIKMSIRQFRAVWCFSLPLRAILEAEDTCLWLNFYKNEFLILSLE